MAPYYQLSSEATVKLATGDPRHIAQTRVEGHCAVEPRAGSKRPKAVWDVKLISINKEGTQLWGSIIDLQKAVPCIKHLWHLGKLSKIKTVHGKHDLFVPIGGTCWIQFRHETDVRTRTREEKERTHVR